MSDNYSFLKKAHLRQKTCFDRVFKSKKRLNGSLGAMRYVANDLDYSRLGIIISKKNMRRAVDRNRLRRILREQFRHHQHQLMGFDLVFVAFKEAREAERSECHQCIDQLFNMLVKRSSRS